VITVAVHWAVLLSAFAGAWFLSLLCLLPVGLDQVDANTGAPQNPRLLLKMAWATVIAVVVFAIFYTLIATHVLDL
jgi:predicted secreted protein